MKSRQCVFIDYGQDKFMYRFYDSIERKLVRSKYVVFMEDQTIKDTDKSKNLTQIFEGLIDIEATPLHRSKVRLRLRFMIIHSVQTVVVIMVRHQLLRTNLLL